MTEEVPKNHNFLKFIVIFMGILILLGLTTVVWKVIDLARQRAARQEQQAITPENIPDRPFAFEVTLESGEKILETSPTPTGLWIRIGKDGRSRRIILKNLAGKTLGAIRIKRNDEDVTPVE